jgi:DNA helicase-2/ATP-dependent DNA helicase PcrA
MSPKKIKEIMSKPCIKVLTVHSSKGLECENVALYGKFPVKPKVEKQEQSDEIKVFYVGITRAKNRCIIFV